MMPNWAVHLPWPEIKRAAEAHNLPLFLVAAFVRQESMGNTYAMRYERSFRWLVDPEAHAARLLISRDTEVIAQMTSWGLMQLMGGTARGLGFEGHIAELVDPATGLEYGCRYLAKQMTRYPAIPHAIAAYNAGSYRDSNGDGYADNQDYVDKVMGFWNELKGLGKMDLS